MVKIKMTQPEEENIKEIRELVYLSELLRTADFRACFTAHFTSRVKEFQSVSSKTDVKIIRVLQSKLLDPLLFHLKRTNNSNDKITLIQCINEVLKITFVHSVSDFFDIYTVVFFQIFKNEKLPYKPSEELIQCALECCRFLLINSTENVLEKVYTEKNGARFSLGISVAVGVVKEERSVQLRLAALNFLLAAMKFDNQLNYTDDKFNKIGDLFMLYLPGILAPLLEVILRDETQQHIITTKALTCWGHVLCLVMRDSPECERLSDGEIIKQWLNSCTKSENKMIDISKGLKEKTRTKLWLESAGLTLQPLILKLSDLRKHSHPKCRLELAVVMVKLLKFCLRNLKNSLPVIIEVLISSAVDENSEVSAVAERALCDLEYECDKNNADVFVPVIEENLYILINKLPGVIHSKNDELLLLSLKSLSGYIRILGGQNRLQNLFSLSSTLKKLISIIRISFELELYPEVSDQDVSIWDNEVKCTLWYKQWKRFRHFNDQSIRSHLEQICQDLGNFGPTETILDFLLDNYNESPSFRKEILLILNEVILGAKDIKEHTVDQLLNFYLNPENLFLPFQVNDFDCFNLKESQSNIIQVALIMEGMGKLAKQMKEKFKDYLLKSLYQVLLRMGSSFSLIRESASRSAQEIAKACDPKGTVESLVQNNIDYLTYHLTINLKRNDESALDVVTVLIKNSSLESTPNLEEIINSVLKSSSENFDSVYTVSYLRLFQIFVACGIKWTERKENPAILKSQSGDSGSDRLLKYLKEKGKNNGEEDLEVPDGETVGENFEKPKFPRHLKLILAVGNHCLHFLPSKDKRMKVIVLEILNECVWALADWEDELLPLVHNIWSPLTTKFTSVTDPLVINRSFKLLCSLAFTTRDFVRARTLKNVLPTLERFLITQAGKSKLKDSTSGYFFTQNFKLQRELLNNLGKLASSLGLFERQMDLLTESVLPYLSSLQPRELQESCKVFFEDIILYDKYLVWHKVHFLIKNSEFVKNAELVLKMIK